PIRAINSHLFLLYKFAKEKTILTRCVPKENKKTKNVEEKKENTVYGTNRRWHAIRDFALKIIQIEFEKQETQGFNNDHYAPTHSYIGLRIYWCEICFHEDRYNTKVNCRSYWRTKPRERTIYIRHLTSQ
uniref:Uncharacterized protein n=1 Tax=Romanomermis culicivorax TaxID=13658 RepID=A0A915HXT0_ROMCU